MKTLNIIAAAAFSVLAAAGAHAETYEGVHPLTTANSRAEVQAEAVAAAHSANPYAEGASADVPPVVSASTDRARVQAEAVAAAHAPNQNLRREAFAASVIPPQYTGDHPVTRSAAAPMGIGHP
jgi:hypothetical protein